MPQRGRAATTRPTYSPWPGRDDLERAAAALARRLPDELAVVARLAYTYRWTWLADGDALFESIDPHRWQRCGGNAVRLLEEAHTDSLGRAAGDRGLLDRARQLEAAITAEHDLPDADAPVSRERPAAFFCAEFAIHGSLPVYAGGLGVLAGDLVKAASDARVPLVGVGLMYRQGYFRQRLDVSGWQHEYWIDTDPERLPAALVTGPDGRAVTVTVEVRGRPVTLQVWRVDVGRVPLYLLDADRPENDPVDRWITEQLYVGDPWTRLAQYVVLGVGGVRVLRALGIEPGLLHLNEGHASLAAVELARNGGRGLEEARARTVFTTHTPVAAGNDSYDRGTFLAAIGSLADGVGLTAEQLCDLGGSTPSDAQVGVTQLGIRLSRAANGVSARHGEVARQMWQHLFPDRDIPDVPIGHVTNGVHVGTWMSPLMQRLLARGLDAIAPEELWAVRCELRRSLVEFIRVRSVADRLARGESPDYVAAAASAFDPDLLTIGFSRRLATYKRLHLLTSEPERALRLLDGDRPIQLVIAGKAHPKDDDAKRIVQSLFGLKGAPVVGARVVYLHDYDLAMAQRLVAGCDVWVNLPRPPQEASGTSGMKSAMNGGLQLSVLDGWWAEAYDGTNGWAIDGDVDDDHAAQDHRHGAELYRLLESEIVPAFYDRDAVGVPRAWTARVLSSLRTLVPRFSAARMLDDYVSGPYRG